MKCFPKYILGGKNEMKNNIHDMHLSQWIINITVIDSLLHGRHCITYAMWIISFNYFNTLSWILYLQYFSIIYLLFVYFYFALIYWPALYLSTTILPLVTTNPFSVSMSMFFVLVLLESMYKRKYMVYVFLSDLFHLT